jgi:hypothetical protein
VTVLVLPSHALYYEALQRFGYWRDYERWLRDVSAGLEPVELTPLWDFTGYWGGLTERVPENGSGPLLELHWDAVHIKRVLGDGLIDAALGAPAGRGVHRLERAGVEAQLARIHDERAEYLRAHPDQLAVLDEAQQQAGVEPDPAHAD